MAIASMTAVMAAAAAMATAAEAEAPAKVGKKGKDLWYAVKLWCCFYYAVTSKARKQVPTEMIKLWEISSGEANIMCSVHLWKVFFKKNKKVLG